MLAVLNFSLKSIVMTHVVLWKNERALGWDVPGRRVKRENLALT